MKRLIALAGRAGSGKNALAKMLGGHEISFAEPLKRFCQEVFAFTDAQVWGPSEERNKPDERYPRKGQCGRCRGHGDENRGTTYLADWWVCPECEGSGSSTVYLTPRYALQTLGTEWGRACYENVWADLGVRRALDYLNMRNWTADEEAAAYMGSHRSNTVVITDCRFINEAKAVRAAGGEVWRIVRPGSGLSGSAALHPSEAEQESPEFLALVTRTIQNTGTLEDLRRQIADR